MGPLARYWTIETESANCPHETRQQAYVSLVRSQLEYGAVKQEIDRLERIQRQVERFIIRDYHSREKGRKNCWKTWVFLLFKREEKNSD